MGIARRDLQSPPPSLDQTSWANEQRRWNTDLDQDREQPRLGASTRKTVELTIQQPWYQFARADPGPPGNGYRLLLPLKTRSDAYQKTLYFCVSALNFGCAKKISLSASENRSLQSRICPNTLSSRETSALNFFRCSRFSGSATTPKKSSYAENKFLAIDVSMPCSLTARATMSRGVLPTRCKICSWRCNKFRTRVAFMSRSSLEILACSFSSRLQLKHVTRPETKISFRDMLSFAFLRPQPSPPRSRCLLAKSTAMVRQNLTMSFSRNLGTLN